MSGTARPLARGSRPTSASARCRSWGTRTAATRCPNRAADNTLVGSERRVKECAVTRAHPDRRDAMSELAPAPHRILMPTPSSKRRSSGSRRSHGADGAPSAEFRVNARLLPDAWWVRSTSEPWLHSLPTTLLRSEPVAAGHHRFGRSVHAGRQRSHETIPPALAVSSRTLRVGVSGIRTKALARDRPHCRLLRDERPRNRQDLAIVAISAERHAGTFGARSCRSPSRVYAGHARRRRAHR
jgi:hypothetical protein